MEKDNNYDFLSMGTRYAKEATFLIAKTAKEIQYKYGYDARMEFEAGVACVIPQYKNIQLEFNDVVHGTKDFGIPNTRNNSYFGTFGTGPQYYNNRYNEPNNNDSKRRK